MIYLLFVFLMVVVLLNLLIGLAVFDTQEIRRNAETFFFVVRVKILRDNNIYRISQKLFGPNKINEGKLSVYPNRWKPPFLRLLFRSTDLSCFSHCIRTKRQPIKKTQSPEEKLTAVEKELKEMKETLNKIVTLLDIRE